MRRLPDWYIAVSGLVLALWVAFNLIYRLGGDGVQIGGASTSFERRFDYGLYGIDDRHALRVGSHPGDFAVVRIERGVFPFCPLCGVHQSAGSVVNLARFASGDWIYTDYPGTPFADGFNVRTGETFDIPESELPKERPSGWTPVDHPAYKSRSLTFDKDDELTDLEILGRFTRLWTINESCVVFNAAFIVIVVFLAITGGLLLIRRRRAPA